ncbi:MAG TPA: ribose ABC transporter permease [Anaerolineaceae bacterium]|nr:ribose ABC transporter permease [Anaerolineaceae bacterium]
MNIKNMFNKLKVNMAQASSARGNKSITAFFKQNEVILLVIVVFLITIAGIINPRFVGLDNIKTMSRDIAILAIGATGIGFVILTGGIDLSVGSIVAVGGVMSGVFIVRYGLPIWLGISLTLVIGVLIGLIHGLFVTKLKMHGFLITLVSMGVARGAMLVVTMGFPITDMPRPFNYFGQGFLFGEIPVPVVIYIIILAITYFILRYTYIGRHIYAVGGNMEAARLSGVNVDKRVILSYVISTVCATIVGMIQAGRMTMGHPGAGEGFELTTITAAILGGLSFSGGSGSVLGIAIGAVLIGILQNGMIMLNINPYYHKVVIGLVLLFAISFDYMRRRQKT